METPAAAALQRIQAQVPMTPEQYQEMRTQREMYERNKPLSDEELDAMLPGEKEGYKVGGRMRESKGCSSRQGRSRVCYCTWQLACVGCGHRPVGELDAA